MRELRKLVGPYPYNPYLIFLFSFAIYFSRLIPVVSYSPAGYERLQVGGLIILASVIPSTIFSMGALLLQKFRPWSSENTFFYILEVALFHYLNLLYLPFTTNTIMAYIGDPRETLFSISPSIFLTSLIIVLIAVALMHQAERRISERLSTATELVTKLENERQSLIYSDEQLRRQTSQFLHDRVQSDLMVIGMKLKSISGKSSAEVNEVIDRAIIRLENTRASDLKNLIQVLTPNLDTGGLRAAIDVLLEQYRTNMEVTTKIDATTEDLKSEVLLGIFRIVEQSVLNALVHGPAKRVQITVSTDSVGVTNVFVSDDGPGIFLNDIIPGLGTSIIDSWVGILKGSKKIDSAPGHGYQLLVTFSSS